MKTIQEYEKETSQLKKRISELEEENKTLRSEKLVSEVDTLNSPKIEDILDEKVVAEFLKERFEKGVEPEGGNLRAKALMTVDWNAWWLTLAAELIKFVVEKFLEKKEEKKEE